MAANKPLIGVLWNDAHGSANEDIEPDDILDLVEPIQLITYGILISDTEKGLLLTTEEYTERETRRCHKLIPRSLVKEVWIVSKTPRRKHSYTKNTPMVPKQDGTKISEGTAGTRGTSLGKEGDVEKCH